MSRRTVSVLIYVACMLVAFGALYAAVTVGPKPLWVVVAVAAFVGGTGYYGMARRR